MSSLGCSKQQLLPIDSLTELLSWTPSCVSHTLPPELSDQYDIREGSQKPKTLVCHDFKGGYHEDSFIDGCVVFEDPYVFVHWNYVDIFVYFSHHFVTIPPPGWIAAGHQHGCLVLGTVITEWAKGAEICQEMLTDIPSCRRVVDQLVAIAKANRFDGWLINIENVVKKELIGNLAGFMSMLTESCKEALGPRAKVIWYDAVTVEGELVWQNELNDKNKIFFDNCDGIFLNYNWKKSHLRRTQEFANNRNGDVYVGVDVWGRNCCGGFNSWLALDQINNTYLSTAIFAPGWVLESLCAADFAVNNQKFWRLIVDYLPCRRLATLPFNTDFSTGIMKEGCQRYFNLSTQNPQPHYLCCAQGRDANEDNMALKITSSLGELLTLNLTPIPIRLLCTNIPLEKLSACLCRFAAEKKQPVSDGDIRFIFGIGSKGVETDGQTHSFPITFKYESAPAEMPFDFGCPEFQGMRLLSVSVALITAKKVESSVKLILYQLQLT